MLCLLLVGGKKEREKKSEKEMAGALFFSGQTHLAGCAMWDFPCC
jgi:hypothetical protein